MLKSIDFVSGDKFALVDGGGCDGSGSTVDDGGGGDGGG